LNWVTTFRTADTPSADRQLAVELSRVELCRYKRGFSGSQCLPHQFIVTVLNDEEDQQTAAAAAECRQRVRLKDENHLSSEFEEI